MNYMTPYIGLYLWSLSSHSDLSVTAWLCYVFLWKNKMIFLNGIAEERIKAQLAKYMDKKAKMSECACETVTTQILTNKYLQKKTI